MNDNLPENPEPRICSTCTFYYENQADPIQPGCPKCAAGDFTKGPHHRACAKYSSRETDL